MSRCVLGVRRLKHHLATFGSASKKPVAPIEAHFSENKTYSTAEDSHAATHNSFFAAHYQNQYPADEDVREMSDNDTTDVWSGAAVSVAWGELPSAYERRFLEAQPVIPESSREEQISLVLVGETDVRGDHHPQCAH